MLHGQRFFRDEYKNYPELFKIRQDKIFKLWIVMVRKRHDLSGEEFLEAFPQFEERINIWN